MHKKMLLIGFTFLLVGCARIDNPNDYMTLVNRCLSDNPITNEVSLGYKYYLPKGVRKTRDYNYNQVFLTSNDSMYLYVDIISYYYKKELKYEENEKSIYYEKIEGNNKKGYLNISQEQDNYFVRMTYNYSKIEGYTTKENLNKFITLSTIILNSIDYNDTIITKVLEGDFGEFSEVTYELKKPIDASNSFSQFLEEYVQREEEGEQLPDE